VRRRRRPRLQGVVARPAASRFIVGSGLATRSKALLALACRARARRSEPVARLHAGPESRRASCSIAGRRRALLLRARGDEPRGVRRCRGSSVSRRSRDCLRTSRACRAEALGSGCKFGIADRAGPGCHPCPAGARVRQCRGTTRSTDRASIVALRAMAVDHGWCRRICVHVREELYAALVADPGLSRVSSWDGERFLLFGGQRLLLEAGVQHQAVSEPSANACWAAR